jgi:hypothetical protein
MARVGGAGHGAVGVDGGVAAEVTDAAVADLGEPEGVGETGGAPRVDGVELGPEGEAAEDLVVAAVGPLAKEVPNWSVRRWP